MSSALLPMVSMGLNYLLLWQEFVIEWNLWQECWSVSFQDHVNDLRDNLCCWFSLHVKSGYYHCSQCQCDLICICTCLHKHTLSCCIYTHYLLCIFHIPYIRYYLQLSFRILSPYTHVSPHIIWYVICTATYGQHGPELSFTVTGICYWMEFVAGMLKCFISGSCTWFAR